MTHNAISIGADRYENDQAAQSSTGVDVRTMREDQNENIMPAKKRARVGSTASSHRALARDLHDLQKQP